MPSHHDSTELTRRSALGRLAGGAAATLAAGLAPNVAPTTVQAGEPTGCALDHLAEWCAAAVQRYTDHRRTEWDRVFDALHATLTHEQWLLLSQLDDLKGTRALDYADYMLAELIRHLPDAGPAIHVIAQHLDAVPTAENGVCCRDLLALVDN